jgi:hypothetical protein
VVELRLLSTQTGFDVAKALSKCELGKRQAKELIAAGEVFDVVVPLVAIHADLKVVAREKVHELRKDGSASIHLLPSDGSEKQQNSDKNAVRN